MNEWMLGAIAVGAIVFMLGGGGWLWRVATNRARRKTPSVASVAEDVADRYEKKTKAV